MTPAIRRLALIAHVVTSVGWFGAVVAFLVLAVAGLLGEDTQRLRGAYVGMDLIGWSVIVPLSLASLLTGLILSLGTEWGVFRHYWVSIKLVINVLASGVLLLHMVIVHQVAEAASRSTWTGDELRGIRTRLIGDAAAAAIVLLVATALSVLKPRGLTGRGRRLRRERADGTAGLGR
jgi:hypothetical protein